jgi:DNA polymerase III delta prime subunit
VCQAENIQVESSALNSLVEISQGDLRKAINLLQSSHRMHPDSDRILQSDVHDVACVRDVLLFHA